MIDRKELESMETYFTEIQNKKHIEQNVRAVERSLNRLFGEVYHITIIPSTSFKTEFFGMNIYPETSTVETIANMILNDGVKENDVEEVWKKCKEWFIEIDYKLLYNTQLDANPKEVVAVLLHEIGHTISSNSVPHRLYKVVRYKLIKADYDIKKVCKNPKFNVLFDLIVLGGCESKNFNYIDNKKEIDADKFVVSCGYGEYLDSFITKVITVSNNDEVNRTDSDVEGDIAVLTEWTLKNISLLEVRRTSLKKELSEKASLSTSPYTKTFFQKIKERLFGNDDNKDNKLKGMVHENYTMEAYHSIVNESFKDFIGNLGKVKKIKQSDLDVINIELDRIETLDDKYYVLDLIYELLNKVNLSLEYYATGNSDKCSQPKELLEKYKKQLEAAREKVLDMKIVEKQYGLFIKVPAGYEG